MNAREDKKIFDGEGVPDGDEDFDRYVRPTRSRMEKDPAAFHKFIRYALHTKDITQAELLEKALSDRSTVKSTFSRWIKEGKTPRKERLEILRYIFDTRKMFTDDWRTHLANVPDPLFHAFVDFFDIKSTSIDNARAHVVGAKASSNEAYPIGTYALWRHSVENDDEFVFGKLEFSYDGDSAVIRAKMLQPRRADKTDETRFCQRGSLEQFEGYFFRLANMYVMMLRDVATNDIRVTIFNKFRTEKIDVRTNSNAQGEPQIVHLGGFGLGMDGNSLFISPVYAELVDSSEKLASLDQQLDVVSEDKVPPRIVKRLRRYKLIRE